MAKASEALPSEIRKHPQSSRQSDRDWSKGAETRNFGPGGLPERLDPSADDDDWLYPHSLTKKTSRVKRQHGALWSAGYCTDDAKIDQQSCQQGPALLETLA